MNYSMTAAEFNAFNFTLTNDSVATDAVEAVLPVFWQVVGVLTALWGDYIVPVTQFVCAVFVQLVADWTRDNVKLILFTAITGQLVCMVLFFSMKTKKSAEIRQLQEKVKELSKDVQALKDLDAQYEDVDEEIPDTSNDHAIARAMAQDAFDARIAHSAKVMAEATEAIETSKRILSSNALPVYQKTDRYNPTVGQMRWDGAVLSKNYAWKLNGISIW